MIAQINDLKVINDFKVRGARKFRPLLEILWRRNILRLFNILIVNYPLYIVNS